MKKGLNRAIELLEKEIEEHKDTSDAVWISGIARAKLVLEKELRHIKQ